MKAKQIAQRLDRGERTVRDWLKEADYPEVKKRREAGRVPLTHLHLPSSRAGRPESAMVSPFGERSSNRALLERSEPCIVTWKPSSKQK
jgi:hypothetical protein